MLTGHLPRVIFHQVYQYMKINYSLAHEFLFSFIHLNGVFIHLNTSYLYHETTVCSMYRDVSTLNRGGDSLVLPRGRSHKTRRCRGVTYQESYSTKYTTYTKTKGHLYMVRALLAAVPSRVPPGALFSAKVGGVVPRMQQVDLRIDLVVGVDGRKTSCSII